MKNQLMMNGVAIDSASARKSPDGALILNATTMRSGDYEYFAFELGSARERGFDFDDRLIGRIEESEVTAILSQFKGLPMTDDHVFIDIGERAERSCGTILDDGVLENGIVQNECVIHDPTAIVRVTSTDETELSIGFFSNIVWNDERAEGDPHFFVRDIDLNHVAVVKQGRAGPEARLSNHKATLEQDSEMKKITIGDQEFEVEDEVAQEFTRLGEENETLTNSVAETTTERDQARGQYASAKADLAKAKDAAGTDAVRIASEHSAFIDEANTLGHDTSKLQLGNYKPAEEMRTVLKNSGVEFEDDESDDVIRGAWKHAVASAGKSPKKKSAIDDLNPAPREMENSVAESSKSKVSNSYFGGNKSKKKEG